MNRLKILMMVCLALVPVRGLACEGHLYFNPENMGFFGGAVARMAGLTPPEPVFELQHVDMVKAVVGQSSEIIVQFDRPFFSKDVRLQVKGSKNVLIKRGEYRLEEREGSITIPYEVVGVGFDTITLTVTGEHKGDTVRQSGRIYVSASARKPEADEDLQVSGR